MYAERVSGVQTNKWQERLQIFALAGVCPRAIEFSRCRPWKTTQAVFQRRENRPDSERERGSKGGGRGNL